jgi:hypothetical protein
MWNDAIQKSFGYDLQVERLPLGYDYRVTFRPLSVHPKVGADVPLPGYPEPQTVHSGATIALDLFVNPATQQKLVEYIHFQEPGQNLPASGHGSRLTQAYVIRPGDTLFLNVLHQRDLSGPLLVSPDGYVSIRFGGMTKAAGLTTQELSSAIARRLATFFTNPQVNVQVLRINQLNGSAPPRDFSLEDAELRIAAPRIRFNGKPLPITDGYKGNVSGRTVWFYLPQSGRYTLSLLPRQIKGFIKAGEVRGLGIELQQRHRAGQRSLQSVCATQPRLAAERGIHARQLPPGLRGRSRPH